MTNKTRNRIFNWIRLFGHVLRHPVDHLSYLIEIRRVRDLKTETFDPRNFNKYLRACLATELTTRERREIILSHYKIIGSNLLDSASIRAWNTNWPIWEQTDPVTGQTARVMVGDSFSLWEGENQITFWIEDDFIFRLSFSLFDSEIIGLDLGHVVFIGGLQGIMDARERLRAVAKANHEISAPAMLLLAARAIATAFGCGAILAVSREAHVSLRVNERIPATLYDDLWLAEGGERVRPWLFAMPALESSIAAKALTSGHKSRTRRKRDHKIRLVRLMRTELEARFGLAPSDSLSRPAEETANDRRPDQAG